MIPDSCMYFPSLSLISNCLNIVLTGRECNLKIDIWNQKSSVVNEVLEDSEILSVTSAADDEMDWSLING